MQDLCTLQEHSATVTALIQVDDSKTGNFRKPHGCFKKSRSSLYISTELKCNRQTVVNLLRPKLVLLSLSQESRSFLFSPPPPFHVICYQSFDSCPARMLLVLCLTHQHEYTWKSLTPLISNSTQCLKNTFKNFQSLLYLAHAICKTEEHTTAFFRNSTNKLLS